MLLTILFPLFFSVPYNEACVKASSPEVSSTTPVVTVPPSCTSCNANTIAPTLTDPDTSFESTELVVYECRITTLICKRTDNKLCASVKIKTSITGDAEIYVIAYKVNGNSVSRSIYCAQDGTYFYNPLFGINQLYCDFENCEAPGVQK